ncbi:NADP-dependent oxidoreductase [Chryseobacterium sp. CKR4-1]|uniref:NADP-dependent oxidoreductase n=1 Tax=Chryseobacterium sp. CKR4-1 TaxID=3068896 RepID=UPI002796DD23|nr:NADP-dependent oxidoreductase [Chryseobacterium sp. CKR4-1]MDQ1805078.1 NADP-dependent oxidoreductase [Chryseobacterium sp. CKR4-1]
MKALQVMAYGGPENLVLNEIPKPSVKPNEVLIQIKAASVNHIDYGKASGKLKQIFPLELPWIPGDDFSGVVIEKGSDVSAFEIGDEVYGNSIHGGTYAEYIAVNEEYIALKPRSLNFEQAASVPVSAQTAWQAVFTHGNLKKEQTVLIHGGAGSVGGFAIQFAHSIGANVITTASKDNFDYLYSLGASKVIDYKNEKFEELDTPIDLVLDFVGGDNQIRSLKVLKPNGKLVATNQPIAEEIFEDYSIAGILMHMQISSQLLKEIANKIDSNELQIAISEIYPLEDASQAWIDLQGNLSGRVGSKIEAKKLRRGKAILSIC